jgi:2-aminoadipate transaminase
MSSSKPIRYSSVGETLEVPVINQLMAIPLEKPEILSLAAGFTDNAALPVDLVTGIVAKMPETNPNNEFLQYGTTVGRPVLRELTCKTLNEASELSEPVFDPSRTFISNGSQQALFLATHTLCDPGDIVLVESPTYFVYLSMLQGLQVKPVGIPALEDGSMDHNGLREVLTKLKQDGLLSRVKLSYLIGYYANPSSRCLALEEKTEFAKVLEEFDLYIPVIEDGAYRNLYFESPHPTPSIMELDEFNAFPKLYLGTYTKPFATGMKIGYACCSEAEWTAKMLCAKGNQDFGTANFTQAIIEQVLLQDLHRTLLTKLSSHYHAKAKLLNDTLEGSGIREKGWHWNMPEGGLLMWVRGPRHVNTNMDADFCDQCTERGVIYVPGNFCFANQQPNNFIRLSIGALSDTKLIEAASRFCDVALKA